MVGKIVELREVTLNYHTLDSEVVAIQNVSFDIEEGEFVSIVGPSGCGKSTILSLIAGLMKASHGKILVGGRSIDGPSAEVGYMLQKDHLLEWRTVFKNILIGLEIQNKMTEENIAFADRLIERYGLKDFAQLRPGQLSGGMRQRVALIRTLATNPEVLLLDESFSALDYQMRLVIADEIWKIIKDEQKTAILVTHDIAEAVSISDKVIVMSRRPGHVKAVHPITFDAEYNTPMKRREAPAFNHFYNMVWKEMDACVL